MYYAILWPANEIEDEEEEVSDVWFWGEIGPDEDDLPLAWLLEYAAEAPANGEE